MATKKSTRRKAAPKSSPQPATSSSTELPSGLIRPIEEAVAAIKQGFAMAEVLRCYYMSEQADAAPIRDESLYAYCDLVSDRLRTALRELGPLVGVDDGQGEAANEGGA